MKTVKELKRFYRDIYKEHLGVFPKCSTDMVRYTEILLEKFGRTPGELVPYAQFMEFTRQQSLVKQQTSMQVTGAFSTPDIPAVIAFLIQFRNLKRNQQKQRSTSTAPKQHRSK